MRNTLTIGSKGEDVKYLQTKLNEIIKAGLTVDGHFGINTDKALKIFQKTFTLTVDGICGNATWRALEGNLDGKDDNLYIINKPLPIHLGTSKGRAIKYLVIHYTAGASSAKGRALHCYDTFIKREASADYAVDDEEIVCFNTDPKNKYCWAVGDGKGKYGITNTNSVSIEMCSNLKKGGDASVPYKDWYLTDATINNTVKLAKYLMKKHNISLDRVIRHWDASHKNCPGIIGWIENAKYNSTDKEWIKFKERLCI